MKKYGRTSTPPTHRKEANPAFYEGEALQMQYTPARARWLFKTGIRADLLMVATWASIKAAKGFAAGIGTRPRIQFGRRSSGRFKDARESFYALALLAAYDGADRWRAAEDNRTAKLAKLARGRRGLPGFERYIFGVVDYILGQLTNAQHAHGPGFSTGEAYASGYFIDADGGVRLVDPDQQLAKLIYHRGIVGAPDSSKDPPDLRADSNTLRRFQKDNSRAHDLAVAVQPYTRVSQARYVSHCRKRKDYKTQEDYERSRDEFAAELGNACDLLHVFANWAAPTFAGRPLPPDLQFWVDSLEELGRYTLRPGTKFPKGDEVNTPEGQAVLLSVFHGLLPALQKARERGGG